MRETIPGVKCPACGASATSLSGFGGLECNACGHHWFEAKETLEEVVAGAPDDDDPMGALVDAMRLHGEIATLSNAALADALMEEAWAEMRLGTRAEALIFEAIDRLRGEDE